MRDIPQTLEGCKTLCRVWVLTLQDETRLGFSDHDRPLSFGGVVCKPASGFTPETANAALGFDVDNGTVRGVLDGIDIEPEDIRAGRYDSARLDHYRVDWTAPDQFVHMSTGLIGEIKQQGHAFEAEWLGEASVLERSTGRVFSRMCDAGFGDARCGVDVASFPEGTICPRTFSACRDQFSNSINFRGFPYLLGDDALVVAPLEGETRDGGSRFS